MHENVLGRPVKRSHQADRAREESPLPSGMIKLGPLPAGDKNVTADSSAGPVAAPKDALGSSHRFGHTIQDGVLLAQGVGAADEKDAAGRTTDTWRSGVSLYYRLVLC